METSFRNYAYCIFQLAQNARTVNHQTRGPAQYREITKYLHVSFANYLIIIIYANSMFNTEIALNFFVRCLQIVAYTDVIIMITSVVCAVRLGG